MIKENFKKIFVPLFVVVLALGIFLRVYNHSDWLRFNADQARDAKVVTGVVEGNDSWPILGPKAGGTDFKLGPAFYYFQIVSAKIFGDTPDRMAYPDLIFSILTIPLLYFFLRMYFNRYISLAGMAIMSVSMFAIQYSRFGWNPNSAPFFTLLFLYAFLMLGKEEKKYKYLWAAIAGVAIGVGVELHTLLLIIMPITAIIFLTYLWKKKIINFAAVLMVIAIALIINVPQITSEIKTGGKNIQAFFGGAENKTGRGNSIIKKIAIDATCQIQSNAYIVSSLGSNDECGMEVISDGYQKVKSFSEKLFFLLGIIISTVFTLGGFVFWIMAVRKEKDQSRKQFLLFGGIYILAVFVLLIPLAKEISMRFYLAANFVPFVLLGLWLNYTYRKIEKYKKLTGLVFGLIVAILAASNFFVVRESFAALSGEREDSNTTAFITLGEVRFISNYIISHAGSQKTVYVDGKQQYVFKYLDSFEYFTEMSGISLKQKSDKENIPEDAMIVIVGNAKNQGKLSDSMSRTYNAKDINIFGRFSVAVLEKKQ